MSTLSEHPRRMPRILYVCTLSDPGNATYKLGSTTVRISCRGQKYEKGHTPDNGSFYTKDSFSRVLGYVKPTPERSREPFLREDTHDALAALDAELSFCQDRRTHGIFVCDMGLDLSGSEPRSTRATMPDVSAREAHSASLSTSIRKAVVGYDGGSDYSPGRNVIPYPVEIRQNSQRNEDAEPMSGMTTPVPASPSLSGATLAISPTTPKRDPREAGIDVTPVQRSSPTLISDYVSSRNKSLRSTQIFGAYSTIPAVLASSFDRFLPLRAPADICHERLLTSKNAKLLSAKEKATRRTSALSDPFLDSSRPSRLSIGSSPYRGSAPAAFPVTLLAPRIHSQDESSRGVNVAVLRRMRSSVTIRGLEQGSEGRGSQVADTTSTPRYKSRYLRGSSADEDREVYEKRIALALGLDPVANVLNRVYSRVPLPATEQAHAWPPTRHDMQVTWTNNEWTPNRVDRFLEAPNLRNDFYCSVLTYSKTAKALAVGLGDKLYLWSERRGVSSAPSQIGQTFSNSTYITSLSFSSESGGHAILAIGRSDGQITLYSPIDEELRLLKLTMSTPSACVSFRPIPHRRISQRHSAFRANNEVLLVGEDSGLLSLFFVEWPTENERNLFSWEGAVLLYVRVQMHTQQICGIAWSSDGSMFATGGNDNLCCLFDVSRILKKSKMVEQNTQTLLKADSKSLAPRHQWRLTAAVKAMAFCSWQKGLIAVGGGSNDRCIHFFHTLSSARLATIDCAAQVTALMWSRTKREVAATFGFAQPDHPYRIAVYSWPCCQQVLAIPWQDDMRALYAIPYPGGPPNANPSTGERGDVVRGCRTKEEGCIVVAASDGSIKFHEIWYGRRGSVGTMRGMFGGSSILEGMHGIEKESIETIR